MKNRNRGIVSLVAGIFCGVMFLSSCNESSGIYKAGTYTATEKGYVEDITVEVEFDSDSMVSVKIIEQNETVGVGDKAIGELPDKIVESQTYEVDAVTTATVTSDAIKSAVKDCMEQAKTN